MAADAMNFNVSPGYFSAAGTTMLAGRDISWHDDKKAPVVAVVNEEFARKVFGSVPKALGGYFKFWGGDRAQVVGVVENGKYRTLTEDQQPAMFFPILQHGSSDIWLVVRSDATRRTWPRRWSRRCADFNGASVQHQELGRGAGYGVVCGPRGQRGIGSAGAAGRDAGGDRDLRHGVVCGEQAAARAGHPRSARRATETVLRAALGRAFLLLATGSLAGIVLGVLATKVLSYIVYEATPKDPVVLGGVVVSMVMLGLVAAWIPALKALRVDPMILLRDQ